MKDQQLKIDYKGYMIIGILIIMPLVIILNAFRRDLPFDESILIGLSVFPVSVLVLGFPFMSVGVKNTVLQFRYSLTPSRNEDIHLKDIAKYSHSIRFQRIVFYDQTGKKIRAWWYLHNPDPVLEYLRTNSKSMIVY